MYFDGTLYDAQGAYFFLAMLDAKNNGDSGLTRKGNFSVNTWVNVTVNATLLGYQVDDIMTGLEFCAKNCNTIYIDYITFA